MEGFAKNCGKQNGKGGGVRERLWGQLAKFCMNLVSTLKSNLQCEYTHTIRRLEVLYVYTSIENRRYLLTFKGNRWGFCIYNKGGVFDYKLG